MSEGFVLDTPEKIEAARWLTIRMGLRTQVRTGMVLSRGTSMIKLANQITGKTDRTAKAAHASMNELIVQTLGQEFDQKL